jgi:hypothetical protein
VSYGFGFGPAVFRDELFFEEGELRSDDEASGFYAPE